MIDSSVLVDNLVAALRDIPDLVTEVGSDSTRIYAYHDHFPKKASLAHAIHAMPAPGAMAVWQGTAPGSFGASDVWKHQVTLYLRARQTDETDPPTAYYRLFRLITKGTPAVRCPKPGCRRWHHQTDELPCWVYAPSCGCDQPTTLDDTYHWTPEAEGL
jgi:hypothetical protein